VSNSRDTNESGVGGLELLVKLFGLVWGQAGKANVCHLMTPYDFECRARRLAAMIIEQGLFDDV
jgi:hypothetical protein